MHKIITTSKAPLPIGAYSQAILIDKTLYSSGQIALDISTGELVGKDISEQTEKVITNLSSILQEADMTLEHVVKTTCFLSDMKDFTSFNNVYAKHFMGKPARSCVVAANLPKDALVEIEVIAVK